MDAETLACASAFATLSNALRGPDDVLAGDPFPFPTTTDG
jgi:hypothetical protein